jgi:PAS domain S-box-containing protein
MMMHWSHKVFALSLLLIPVAGGAEVMKDTVLSVTAARIDADSNFVPDRLGQVITVAGRSSVYSGVLHTSRLSVFLQDHQSGIELYNVEPGEPIAEGDSVVATGTLEMYEGVTRLTRATFKVYKPNGPMARAIPLHVKDAPSEKYEGMLIRVSGEVTRYWSDAYGAFLTLRESAEDPDSVVVFLSFRHKPGIDLSAIVPGERILITGILGQYVRGGPLNIGYEIYPRYPEDVRIESGNSHSYLMAALISACLLLLALAWVVAMRRQVSRRTRQVQESEQRFRNLLEDIQLVAVNIDIHSRVEFANKYFLSLAGWTRGEILGRPWHDMFAPPELTATQRQDYEARIRDGSMPEHIEAEIVTRRGERRLLAWTTTVTHGIDGDVSGVACIGEDITERRRTEQKLEASLLEKEVLLKEVYHRVKNNLQTVSSVLSLQAAATKDPETRALFIENQHRVRSMALIHEKLYKSKTLAQIDFREYLDGLATSLFRTYWVSGDVSLRVDVHDVSLDIDASITCGLLINELLSNALKYAFPEGKSGEISISMQPANDSEYILTFADTGVGFPPGFDLAKSTSLGLSLIGNLVRQLNGKMEISSDSGTRYVITFPSI